MDFSAYIASGTLALAEGAVVERVARDPTLSLDPHIGSGGLIYDPRGRARLAEIHGQYMNAARAAGLPLLSFTDTWRCAEARLEASAFAGRPVNEDNARFLIALRDRYGEERPIFVGGQTGPTGDAYKPAESLPRRQARAFHQRQIDALAGASVDFLQLSTAPSVDEALGVADAMARTGLPYVISFVIRRSGVVLDGTPLAEAIRRIDAEAARPPLGFSINCVHARVLDAALKRVDADALGRLITFQANTADREVEDLDGSAELLTEPAEAFAERVAALRRRYGLRALGGCCGTDGSHINALARRLCRFEASA